MIKTIQKFDWCNIYGVIQFRLCVKYINNLLLKQIEQLIVWTKKLMSYFDLQTNCIKICWAKVVFTLLGDINHIICLDPNY